MYVFWKCGKLVSSMSSSQATAMLFHNFELIYTVQMLLVMFASKIPFLLTTHIRMKTRTLNFINLLEVVEITHTYIYYIYLI